MNTKNLIFILIILLSSIYSKAQIAIDCTNERIGLGFGITSPGYDIDMRGRLKLTLPNSSYFTISTLTPELGTWGLRPNASNIGVLGYAYQLYLVNAKYIYGDVINESDKNLKKNIVSLYDASPIINKLRPVSFDYDRDYSDTENVPLKNKLEADDKNRLGFIAQEVQQILPQSVITKTTSDSILGIRMIDFIPLLVKSFQEQTVRIDSLESLICELKASKDMFKSARIEESGERFDDKAKLYQNAPNPFSEQTIVSCFVPNSSNDARLLIFDMQGTLVKTMLIPGRNQTSVTIAGAELNAGMYIYSLIIDNKEIDSKRMILSN